MSEAIILTQPHAITIVESRAKKGSIPKRGGYAIDCGNNGLDRQIIIIYWLKIKDLNPDEKCEFDRQAQLTPSEKYWYETLFPTWFKTSDPKLTTWTKKLMADEFPNSDLAIISEFANEFENLAWGTNSALEDV